MTTRLSALLNINLRWFLLAMILANIAGNMVYSLLSIYLVELGASVSQVGLAFTVASLVPAILQIFGGWLSDTIGRLRTIALGSSIAFFGYLLFFLSPSWGWIVLGLCIESVSNAMVGPSFAAYIAEQSDENLRGRVFGLSTSLYMIVTVIGPAMAGFLAYRFGFRWMLLVAFAFYAAATGVRLWMALAERFASRREAEKPTWLRLKTQMGAMFALLVAGGILTWIWVTDAVGDTAFNMISQLYPIYLSEIGGLNVEQIGLVNASMGIAMILSSFAAGWLSDRFGERLVIVQAFLIEGMGVFVLLQASGYSNFLLAMFIFGFGTGSLIPAYNSLITKVVPEEKRGLAFGLFGTSLGLLSLPFPWIGGQLWERFAPAAPFWITFVACLISVPIAWVKFRLPETETEPA